MLWYFHFDIYISQGYFLRLAYRIVQQQNPFGVKNKGYLADQQANRIKGSYPSPSSSEIPTPLCAFITQYPPYI
jgi:hypothetical protein